MPKLSSKRRQEFIDHLVGNCDCEEESQFDESDTETLNKFSTEYLEDLATSNMYHGDHEDEEGPTQEVEEDDEDTEEEEELPPTGKKVMKKEVKNEEYVFNFEDLPADIQEDIKFAQNAKREQKDELIAKITANESGAFSAKELEAKSIEELEKISSYLPEAVENEEEPAPIFQRVAAPRLGGNAVKLTSNKEKLDDVLDVPVMTWN